MKTTELKKLAEAATPGPWHFVGFRVTAKELGYARVADTEFDNESMAENAAYIAAANPAAILKLLAINAELVEALKKISAIELKEFGADWEEIEEAQDIADAALAKAEGGEL